MLEPDGKKALGRVLISMEAQSKERISLSSLHSESPKRKIIVTPSELKEPRIIVPEVILLILKTRKKNVIKFQGRAMASCLFRYDAESGAFDAGNRDAR
jgi:hypothetical protein